MLDNQIFTFADSLPEVRLMDSPVYWMLICLILVMVYILMRFLKKDWKSIMLILTFTMAVSALLGIFPITYILNIF